MLFGILFSFVGGWIKLRNIFMRSYRNLGQDLRQAYEHNGSLSIGFSPGAGRSRLHCGAAVHLRPKPPAGRTNRDATGRSRSGSLNLKASVTI